MNPLPLFLLGMIAGCIITLLWLIVDRIIMKRICRTIEPDIMYVTTEQATFSVDQAIGESKDNCIAWKRAQDDNQCK